MYLVDAAERGRIAIAICITILIMIGVSAMRGTQGIFDCHRTCSSVAGNPGNDVLLRGIAIILTHGGSISGLPKAFYKSIGNMMIFGVP